MLCGSAGGDRGPGVSNSAGADCGDYVRSSAAGRAIVNEVDTGVKQVEQSNERFIVLPKKTREALLGVEQHADARAPDAAERAGQASR